MEHRKQALYTRRLRSVKYLWRAELGIMLQPIRHRFREWLVIMAALLKWSADLILAGEVPSSIGGIVYGLALFAVLVVAIVLVIFFRNSDDK